MLRLLEQVLAWMGGRIAVLKRQHDVAARLMLRCLFGLVLYLATTTIRADEWSATLALTSDYLSRGQKRSSDPVPQVHIGWNGDRGWSAGLWASEMRLRSRRSPDSEIDFYLVRHARLSKDWRLSGQLTCYTFQGEAPFSSYDYVEFSATASFRDALALSVAFSPAYSSYSRLGDAHDKPMLSYELTGRHALSRQLQVTAGIGHQDLSEHFDAAYWYWSAGAEWSWRRLSLDLSYVDTDSTATRLFGYRSAADTWVATIAWRLH